MQTRLQLGNPVTTRPVDDEGGAAIDQQKVEGAIALTTEVVVGPVEGFFRTFELQRVEAEQPARSQLFQRRALIGSSQLPIVPVRHGYDQSMRVDSEPRTASCFILARKNGPISKPTG